MRKRSIFFKSAKKKKLIFHLSICVFVIFIVNAVGTDRIIRARAALIGITTEVNKKLQDVYSWVISLKYFLSLDVNERIIKLYRENQKLAYEIDNLKRLKEENLELRSLLKLKKQIPDKIIVAKVISVFSSDYMRSYVLDMGAADGIEAGDVVRNKDGFVGRISEVYDTWCCAIAATDINSKLSVKIGEESINAIISGNNSGMLSISMKHEDAVIKYGDIAETAYSKNPICDRIPVGKVIEKHGSLFIKPFADLNSLQYVCILKNT